MMKKKEVIEALTAIKGYCDEHYCGDCCIRYICDNNFSGFPDDWEIPGVEDTLPVVYIKPVNGGKVPEKKTEGAAAWDCYAREGVDVYNGETYKVPLGFALAMPEGVFATLIPRSILGLKTDLIMANSQGLISDIHIGDRIAQIYFNEPVNLVVVYDEFPDEVRDTERGESGFGSTGK